MPHADFSQLLPSERPALDAHVVAFEKWFVALQRQHGFEGAALTNPEHAIVRSYIAWLRGGQKGPEDVSAPQAR